MRIHFVPDLFDKPLFARFNQEQASSDGGAILLKAAERIYGLVKAFAGCLFDKRAPDKTRHAERRVIHIPTPSLLDEVQVGLLIEVDRIRQDWPPSNTPAHERARAVGCGAPPLGEFGDEQETPTPALRILFLPV